MNSRFSTRSMLIILSVLSFMLGVRMAAAMLHPVDYVLVIVIAAMMVFLCVRDAHQHGRVILHAYRWIMFLTWPWSIVFYYVFFGGIKGIVRMLLWGTIFSCFYVGGEYLFYFIVMWWPGG